MIRALPELVERLRKQKRGAPDYSTRKTLEPETRERMAPNTAPAREPGPRSNRGRHVPIAVSRAVWTRDGSQCAYVDERGRRCVERRGLELHHRKAYALGGLPTEANLELRCRAHNTLAAENDFGREHMDRMRGGAPSLPP